MFRSLAIHRLQAIHRIALHPNPLRSMKTCLLQQLLKMTMIDVINQKFSKSSPLSSTAVQPASQAS